MAAGLPAAAEILRAHDPGRFQTTLFAPPPQRAALIALYAFDCEIGRVRHVVSQPMAGLIRLQWWRDALDGIAAGAPLQHPVVQGLHAAWPELAPARAELDRAIDARESELEGVPFATLGELEQHVAATGGSIARAAATACGSRETRGPKVAAECVGRASALLQILREAGADARAGRMLLPRALLAAHGLDPETALARAAEGGLVGPARAVADRAEGWLERARRQYVGRQILPAVLPGTLARRWLSRLRRAGDDPLDPALSRPDPLLPLVLLGRRWLGRF